MLKKWFFIIRPFTLSASLSPIIIGIALAENINWLIASITIICGVTLQILSNLVNDLFDYKKGADSNGRLGPKRAISEGTITEKQLKNAIYIVLTIIVLTGAYLLYVGGWVIGAIGVSAIFFAWLYSATSHSLSSLGIADCFTLTYYGFFASWGTTYLLTHSHSINSLLLGLGCGAISTAILTTNNIRDIEADKAVNKKTLIVRFGTIFGKVYYTLMICVPIVLTIFITQNIIGSILITLAGIALFILFMKAKGSQYNKILMLTGLYDLFYAIVTTFCV